MILNSKILGADEKKIIILHGFLGSLDNWVTFAKKLSNNGYEVHLIDQRNHGKSFHSDDFNYELMANDLYKYLYEKNINKTSILGHSVFLAYFINSGFGSIKIDVLIPFFLKMLIIFFKYRYSFFVFHPAFDVKAFSSSGTKVT